MERDLLSASDIRALSESAVANMLQRAARLGAERERERAARVADAAGSNHDYTAEMAARYIAAAIRRGEGEQA